MNILDHLECDFVPFSERPLGELDSLVFTQLAMVKDSGMIPLLSRRQVGLKDRLIELGNPNAHRFVYPTELLKAERFNEMLGTLARPEQYRQLLFDCAASPRMRNLRIWGAVDMLDEARQMQFAAISITCPHQFTYVAFRGTDGTFTGWREDFNMGFMPQVAGQAQAVNYLEAVARYSDLPLYVGGHSKGGNLAAYAALKCAPSVRERIRGVFDHDGPGFRETAVSDKEFDSLLSSGIFHKTVPSESVVGMLLESRDCFRVVRSSDSGVMQHDPFTWQVDLDTHDFVYDEGLSATAEVTRRTFAQWIARYSDEELGQIVDAIFSTLASTGASDLHDLTHDTTRMFAMLGTAALKLQDPARSVLIDAAAQFASAAGNATATTARSRMAAARSAMSDAVDGLSDRLKFEK